MTKIKNNHVPYNPIVTMGIDKSEFGIFACKPLVFSVDHADVVPLITKKNILEYVEYLLLTNGSVKVSATSIADLIDSWRIPTRPKLGIYS